MRCVQLQEKKAMIENCGRWDFDFIPPVDTISITLDVSPLELELALPTSGMSLCRAMMNAIVAAMVVDQGCRWSNRFLRAKRGWPGSAPNRQTRP